MRGYSGGTPDSMYFIYNEKGKSDKMLKFEIKGKHNHIKDIGVKFFDFWELIDFLNQSHETNVDVYISILNDLINHNSAEIGDYIVELKDNDINRLKRILESLNRDKEKEMKNIK